jgi:hypothetical protein
MPMAIVSHAEITAQIPEALSTLMVTSTGSSCRPKITSLKWIMAGMMIAAERFDRIDPGPRPPSCPSGAQYLLKGIASPASSRSSDPMPVA